MQRSATTNLMFCERDLEKGRAREKELPSSPLSADVKSRDSTVAERYLDGKDRARAVALVDRSVYKFCGFAPLKAACFVFVELFLQFDSALRSAEATQGPLVGKVLHPHGHQRVACKLDNVTPVRRDQRDLGREIPEGREFREEIRG